MKNKIWGIGIFMIVVILIAILLFREKEYTATRFMMDSVCDIKVVARLKPTHAITEAFKVMQKIDSLASFSGNGDIARINRGENIKPSTEVMEMIEAAMQISKMTDGAFDITIRPAMELWGDFKDSQNIPTDEEIKKVLPLIGYEKVAIIDGRVKFQAPGMKIDLSGIAQGYAVDRAVEKLKSMGIKKGLVNLSGDIGVFGDRVWKIGIKDPRGQGITKVLKLKNQSVETSGDYERYFIVNGVRYHHILNPKTCFPVGAESRPWRNKLQSRLVDKSRFGGGGTPECISVTVIADRTIIADALATGVFVLGPVKGKALLDSLRLQGIIVSEVPSYRDEANKVKDSCE
ncbi:MAG: FAD:protein FMN transferase [Candidatus Stahlbacteria bacterium]|nr:FAD:protein FMN transferase [Candidatus Stahlbacteria bacterium]